MDSVVAESSSTAGHESNSMMKIVFPGTSGFIPPDGKYMNNKGECVIDQKLFDKKYFGKREDGLYANARNFVAGVLGKDDYSLEKVADLTLIPVALLVNGIQTDLDELPVGVFGKTFQEKISPNNYVECVKSMEILRQTFEIPLDGVVLSTPYEYRELLGENDHDPEWSISVKFVPDEVVTRVMGIEWNISKTGELNPVVLLVPVHLNRLLHE